MRKMSARVAARATTKRSLTQVHGFMTLPTAQRAQAPSQSRRSVGHESNALSMRAECAPMREISRNRGQQRCPRHRQWRPCSRHAGQRGCGYTVLFHVSRGAAPGGRRTCRNSELARIPLANPQYAPRRAPVRRKQRIGKPGDDGVVEAVEMQRARQDLSVCGPRRTPALDAPSIA